MEPIDPDNMTEEERRRADHPFIAWLLVVLLLGTAIVYFILNAHSPP
jgi:hypothetical protein